jgi:hypothetical protein
MAVRKRLAIQAWFPPAVIGQHQGVESFRSWSAGRRRRRTAGPARHSLAPPQMKFQQKRPGISPALLRGRIIGYHDPASFVIVVNGIPVFA